MVVGAPGATTRAFFDAVGAHAGHLTGPIAGAWSALRPGSPREVAEELGGKLPEFTSQLQADVVRALETVARPVLALIPAGR